MQTCWRLTNSDGGERSTPPRLWNHMSPPKLDDIAKKMGAAFNAKNATRLARLYCDDAVLMPPGESLITGRAAIRSWFKKAFARLGRIQMVPKEARSLRDEAFQVGTFQMRPGLKSSAPIAGKYVLLLRRTKGRWLIQYDIWNLSNLPEARS